MIVYLIRNTINGKLYVGQTVKKLSTRWSMHVHAALKQNRTGKFCNAIRKYGPTAFEMIVLGDALSKKELDEKEKLIIDTLSTRNRNIGYNVSVGGDAGTTGVKFSADTRKRMSAASLGRKKSPEHRRKIGDANTGKPWHGILTDAGRETKRVQMLGNTNLLGHRHSEETKRKISLASKGRKLPPRSAEWCQNISKAKKGIPRSPRIEQIAA